MCGTRICEELSKIINQRGGLESHLSCGRDEQTQAVDGDVDSDAHACKPQVALPHDCLQSLVHGLKEGNTIILKYSHIFALLFVI